MMNNRINLRRIWVAVTLTPFLILLFQNYTFIGEGSIGLGDNGDSLWIGSEGVQGSADSSATTADGKKVALVDFNNSKGFSDQKLVNTDSESLGQIEPIPPADDHPVAGKVWNSVIETVSGEGPSQAPSQADDQSQEGPSENRVTSSDQTWSKTSVIGRGSATSGSDHSLPSALQSPKDKREQVSQSKAKESLKTNKRLGLQAAQRRIGSGPTREAMLAEMETMLEKRFPKPH